MIPWMKKLFTDETVFVRLARAGCVAVGGMIVSGTITGFQAWVGPALMAAGTFLGAGERNQ